MQDQKNNLSISNSNTKPTSFIKQVALFFIPVISVFLIIEYLTISIPTSYDTIRVYGTKQKEHIEVMVLGSSQMQAAVNPEHIDMRTINYASTSQHHGEDFKILKQTIDKFPSLETIIFELSYAHLEIPHNGKDFWKNAIYLKYYNVNAFERNVYFKDKFIFLSSPTLYSKKLTDYYIRNNKQDAYNNYGYNTNYFYGKFKSMNYNIDKIDSSPFMIRMDENISIFNYNTSFFYEMLDFAISRNKNVVICTVPLYKTYLKKRNTVTLKRRDSIIKEIKHAYPNVTFLETETDTTHFLVTDYRNENHLNPTGSMKFSKLLNNSINKLN